MSTIDDIKAKLDLVEFLRGQGVELKPAGASFKARCPFHTEKTPSFMVNPAKQVYYCFGCQKGGTIFDFVMAREGLEFGEALRLLAERAGVPLEGRDPRLEGKKTRGLAVLDAAVVFFQQQLAASDGARAYVAQRRIPAAMVEQFAIGYAPDTWDSLTKHLLARGFTAQEAVEAGVAVHGKQSAISNQQSAIHSYDRFRHRLMFPIHDAMGRVVGFTGRILDGGKTVGQGGEAPAKYVNTPETELYKKGEVIYGLAFARDVIRKQGYAVLVEGQMDVVASHGAGLPATVAVSGTALTEQQLKLLARHTSRLHMAFDADPAGEGAAERGIDAALEAGFDVRVIVPPRGPDGAPLGKDADENIQRDAEAWRAAVAHPTPVLDYFLDRVRARGDLASPMGKRDAGRVLVRHLAHVADPIERAAWATRFARALGVPEAAIRDAVLRAPRARGPAIAPTPALAPRAVAPADPAERLGNRLLAILIRHPEFLNDVRVFLPVDNLSTDAQRSLYNSMQYCYDRKESHNEADHGDRARAANMRELLELQADREFGDLAPNDLRQELLRCGQALRRAHLTSELHRVADRMQAVERDGGTAAQDELATLTRTSRELTDALAMLQRG